jgi:hypothetical protein
LRLNPRTLIPKVKPLITPV